MALTGSELALCAINTGETYQWRLDIAQMRNPKLQAQHWAAYTASEAEAYTRQFSEEGTFTVAAILAAASELAEYYAQHIKEMESVS